MNNQDEEKLSPIMERFAKVLTVVTLAVIIFAIGAAGQTLMSRNLDKIRTAAPAFVSSNGFTIVGECDWNKTPNGGIVCYITRRVPDNGVTYRCDLEMWFDKPNIRWLQAIDAIKPH